MTSATSRPHRFVASKARGVRAERWVDWYMGGGFVIAPVGDEGQRLGIDRIWLDRIHGGRWSVEYKLDERAGETGNYFLETASSVEERKPGWALSSVSQFILFISPTVSGGVLLALVEVRALREQVIRWREIHPTGVAKSTNQGCEWHSEGLLVPMAEVPEQSTWEHRVSFPFPYPFPIREEID